MPCPQGQVAEAGACVCSACPAGTTPDATSSSCVGLCPEGCVTSRTYEVLVRTDASGGWTDGPVLGTAEITFDFVLAIADVTATLDPALAQGTAINTGYLELAQSHRADPDSTAWTTAIDVGGQGAFNQREPLSARGTTMNPGSSSGPVPALTHPPAVFRPRGLVAVGEARRLTLEHCLGDQRSNRPAPA